MYRTLALLMVLAAPTAGAAPVDFVARRDASLHTPAGAAYEKVAKSTLNGSFGQILRCAAAPRGVMNVSIFFEILADGTVGAADVTPRGVETDCILKVIQAARFPPAPPAFIGNYSLLISGHG
jgi:hypothetical protein